MTESETQAPGQELPASTYLPHVARGALINFSGIFARMLLVYAYTFLLARMLPVSQVGQYFLMVTIISLVGLAAVVGLDYGVIRFVALYTGEGKLVLARKILATGLLAGVPVGLIFAAAVAWQAPFISNHFLGSANGAVSAIRIFALAIPLLVAARLFNATTQGMHKMQYQVYARDMGEQVLKVGFSAVALMLGAGLFGVVWANVAALVLATVLSFYFAWLVLKRKRNHVHGASIARRQQASLESPSRAMLGYSYPLALSNILTALWLQIDTLMLGLMGATQQVGYYGVALKVSLVGAKIITAFAVVFTPVIADLWNRGKVEELQQLYTTVSRWIFMLSFPLFIIMLLYSDAMMKIFGKGFIVSSGALVILAVGQLMSASTGAAGIMVLMSGRSKLELMNVSVTLVLDALLCYLLIPRYGVNGAAIANMASLGGVSIMRIVEIKLIMNMFAYDRSYLKPVLAGLTSAAAALLLSKLLIVSIGFKQLAVLALAVVFFYVLTIIILGPDKHDMVILKQFKARVIA